MQSIKQLDLRKYINEAAPVFKLNLPFNETDHVLNIYMNSLAGGAWLDHIEIRRTDEAYLNALGAERIPGPTTAGDFCRRFDSVKIMELTQGINRARRQVWKQQPDGFLDQATIKADGTMVETYGEITRLKQSIRQMTVSFGAGPADFGQRKQKIQDFYSNLLPLLKTFALPCGRVKR